MSGYLFKSIATAAVVMCACVSASVAFTGAPAAPQTGSASESPPGGAIGNSRMNSTILEVTNIGPGDSRSATVTITSRHGEPASFSLAKGGLRQQLGRGGGKLSDRLQLRLEEVTDQHSPTTLYAGSVDSMTRQALGRYAPGESRTYRFTVTFTDGRAALGADLEDNAYMGASLSLRFHWRSQ